MGANGIAETLGIRERFAFCSPLVLDFAVPVRSCAVSFIDARGIRHGVEVEAESLYEAVVHGVCRLSADVWIEKIGPATVLDVEVREHGTKHAISLQQVERWLASVNKSPGEASKKAKLKMMLVQR